MIINFLLTIMCAFLAGMLFGYGSNRLNKGALCVGILCTFGMAFFMAKFFLAMKDAGVLH